MEGCKERARRGHLKFHPKRAKAFLGEVSSDIAWVWEPMIPLGSLCLFAAYMKLGKSTFLYGLLKCIARGEPFLGLPTRKVNVLILAVEEHPREVRNRLEHFGVTEADDDGIFIHAGRLSPSPKNYSDMATFIKQEDIGLVVLDTLAGFIGVEDENSNSEVLNAITPLLTLARSTGAAVLLVHHSGKGEGNGGRNIRGASSLFGCVDQAMMMSSYGDVGGTQRQINTLGRYEQTPKTLLLDYVNYEYVFLGAPMQIDLTAARETLVTILQRSKDPLNINELASLTGLKLYHINKALTILPEGVVRKGKGVRGEPFLFSWAGNGV